MQRYRMLWLVVALLMVTSLACNAFAGEEPPGLLLPPPGLTAVPATPFGQMAPTVTLPGQTAPLPGTETGVPPIITGDAPTVRLLVDLNIRSGPGVQYPRVGFLLQGEIAPILGRHTESGWWRIQCPPLADGNSCWVSGGAQYSAAINAGDVPAVAAPPLPARTPTPGSGGNNGRF